MTGRIVQINTSHGGLPKRPIPGGEVDFLGIVGDHQRHSMHGGPRKALLLIAAEVVDQLCSEGWPLFYGALGENVTTRGLDVKSWRAGQRYRAGGIVLELTEPRRPCSALHVYGIGIGKRIYDEAVAALDPTSSRWGYSGFYASVFQTGKLASDDIIETLDPVV